MSPRRERQPSTQATVDRIQLQIRMTPILRKRLEREAGRRLVSKNFLIERAVEEALDRWEQEAATTATPSVSPVAVS